MLRKLKCSFAMHLHVSILLFINVRVILIQAGPVPRPYYKAPDSNRLEIGNHSLESTPKHPQQSKLRIGGCRYQASVYSSGDLVPIEEPCLNCQCKNTAVVCKLRICSDVQVPPPGCIVVHKANKCCSQIHCPDNNKKISREHRLSSGDIANITMNSLALPEDKGFCVHEGTVYAEGSAMRSSSLCEHCFCIRGEMKCSSPQCVIPLDGCKPRFRSYACCPTNYDCNDSNSTAVIKTPPSSTPIPQFLKGCQVNGRLIREGEPVLPLNLEPDSEINPCQTCFCMGGVVRCRPLECDKPLHGCRPIIKPGHCCPDRYECPMNATAFNQVVMDSLASPGVVLNSGELAHKALTSTEIHAPLALDQNSVNEILSSRIANSLKQQQPPTPLTTSSTEPSTPSSYPADIASREDRRNKDAHDYVIKISRELVDTEGSVDVHKLDDLIPESHVEGGNLSDLLLHEHGSNSTDADGEGDGDELTIALEVITENDVGETTVANNLSIITTTDAALTTISEGSGSNMLHDDIVETTMTNIDTTLGPEAPNELIELGTDETHSSLFQTSSQASNPITTTHAIEEPGNVLLEDGERTTPTPELGSGSSTASPNHESTTITTSTVEINPEPSDDDSSLTNLQFIPFGVEDVMFLKDGHLLKENDASDPQHFPEPIKITFDNTDIRKASLIAPSPPGYAHVPLVKQHHADESEGIITSANLITSVMNDPKSTVFDVPVSTSLYNNGYFSNIHRLLGPSYQNRSIFDHIFEDSSEKRFEDEADDEKDEELANGKSENTTTITSELNTTSDLLEDKTQKPPSTVAPTSTTESHVKVHEGSQLLAMVNNATAIHPSRIYSKFDINDSPYYNRFGESGYDLALLPGQTVIKHETTPSVAVTPSSASVQVDHHRYFEGSDLTKETVGFYPFADYSSTNENDETDNEDEEFVFYEEESLEKGHPDYKEPSFSSKLEKISLPAITTSTLKPEPPKHTTRKPAPVAPKKKPQYYSKTPTSTIKPIVVNTPRPSAPASSTLLFSPQHGSGGFTPVLSFPFVPFPKNKPLDALLHIGLKLSGCNIYGKMYGVGNIIRELSSSCIQCQCTEIGVQCSEINCDGEDMIMMS